MEGRSGWLGDAQEKQGKSLSETLCIMVDTTRHERREAATPNVMGEQLDPPKYGELWSKAASRVFFASYREYGQRVKFPNDEGVVRRQLMSVSQLIPVYVQRCFAQHYYQRRVFTAEELMNALKQHAGYSTAGAQMVREREATEIRRVAKMHPGGGTVKDRVMHVSSALEIYVCENLESTL